MRYGEGWHAEDRAGDCPQCGRVCDIGAFRRSDGKPLCWVVKCRSTGCNFSMTTSSKRRGMRFLALIWVVIQ
jgi:hypothetical protein